jgi:hypothetical protein
MATRQQRIQQERQRQQKEAAARRQLPDRPLGAEAIDAIEQDIAAFTQLPGVRQTLNFVGGAVNLVNETVLEPARYAATDPSQMGSAQALAGTAILGAESLIEKSSRGGEMIAEALNVDPRIGKFIGGGAAEELLTLGAGKFAKGVGQVVDTLPPPGAAPQLATAAATPAPPSMSVAPSFEKGGLVMKAVTITDPKTLRVTGRQTGEDALSPEQAKQQTKRILDIQKAENALAQAEDELAVLADIHGRKPTKEENPRVYRQFQNALGAKGRAQTDLSRAQSNVLVPTEDNPLWYKTTKALFVKKQEQLRRGLTQALEQHHKFPKGLSGAYFSRMDELIDAGLAEPDDLFVMADYARKKGVEAGDVRSNLANQVKKPHTELHGYMRGTGEELSKTKWKQVVKEAKTVDELMVLWRDIIDNNVIPNYKLAEIWQPLDDLVQELRGN